MCVLSELKINENVLKLVQRHRGGPCREPRVIPQLQLARGSVPHPYLLPQVPWAYLDLLGSKATMVGVFPLQPKPAEQPFLARGPTQSWQLSNRFQQDVVGLQSEATCLSHWRSYFNFWEVTAMSQTTASLRKLHWRGRPLNFPRMYHLPSDTWVPYLGT